MSKTKVILFIFILSSTFSKQFTLPIIQTYPFPKIKVISIKKTECRTQAKLIFESKVRNWIACKSDPLKEITNQETFILKLPNIYFKQDDLILNKLEFNAFSNIISKSFYLNLIQESVIYNKTLRYYELSNKPQLANIIFFTKKEFVGINDKEVPYYVCEEIKEENMLCRIECLTFKNY